jgi:large subunit ribosomal protein L21
MYAIIKTGGKQVKVSAGDIIHIEKLAANAGDAVKFDQVLLASDGTNVQVGTPVLAGATVTATVLEQKRDEKVIIFKKRRRQGYRRTKGHRQYLTVVQVTEITAGGKTVKADKLAAPKAAPKAAAKAEAAEAPKKAPAKKAAAKKAAE